MTLTTRQYIQIAVTVIFIVLALIFVILYLFANNEEKKHIYMIIAISTGSFGALFGLYTIYSIYSIYSIPSRSISDDDLDEEHDKQLSDLQKLFDEVMTSKVIMSSSDQEKMQKIKWDMEWMIKRNGVGISQFPIKPDMEEWMDAHLRENMKHKKDLQRIAQMIDELRSTNEFVIQKFKNVMSHPIIMSYLTWNENQIRLKLDDYMRRVDQELQAEEARWEREDRMRLIKEKEKKL